MGLECKVFLGVGLLAGYMLVVDWGVSLTSLVREVAVVRAIASYNCGWVLAKSKVIVGLKNQATQIVPQNDAYTLI